MTQNINLLSSIPINNTQLLGIHCCRVFSALQVQFKFLSLYFSSKRAPEHQSCQSCSFVLNLVYYTTVYTGNRGRKKKSHPIYLSSWKSFSKAINFKKDMHLELKMRSWSEKEKSWQNFDSGPHLELAQNSWTTHQMKHQEASSLLPGWVCIRDSTFPSAAGISTSILKVTYLLCCAGSKLSLGSTHSSVTHSSGLPSSLRRLQLLPRSFRNTPSTRQSQE